MHTYLKSRLPCKVGNIFVLKLFLFDGYDTSKKERKKKQYYTNNQRGELWLIQFPHALRLLRPHTFTPRPTFNVQFFLHKRVIFFQFRILIQYFLSAIFVCYQIYCHIPAAIFTSNVKKKNSNNFRTSFSHASFCPTTTTTKKQTSKAPNIDNKIKRI